MAFVKYGDSSCIFQCFDNKLWTIFPNTQFWGVLTDVSTDPTNLPNVLTISTFCDPHVSVLFVKMKITFCPFIGHVKSTLFF